MTSEWEIGKDDYLKRLDCPDLECLGVFMGLPKIEKMEKIIPLRAMKTIKSLLPMSDKALAYLLSRIKTLDGEHTPYKDSSFRLLKHNPNTFKLGQKYVYREKYIGILEGLSNNFAHFNVVSGLGDLGAYFIFGDDENGKYSLACYIPPIIEQHGENLVIMDGVNRDYIAKQAGMTMHVIIVEKVLTPFPTSFHNWEEISVIHLADRPKEVSERYFDLNKGLFRDLKYLGIDG